MPQTTPTMSAQRVARGGGARPLERRAFLVSFVLYAAWTVAVIRDATDPLDQWMHGRGLAPRSGPGQFAEAFALVTHPYVALAVTLVFAIRSYANRQRRLGLALGVAALAVPLWELQRTVLPRDRPPSLFLDSVAAAGSSYPSGHLVSATILTWVGVTLANSQRRTAAAQWRVRSLGVLLVGTVGVDQWAMGIARGSDLVGGLLLGITVVTAALWLSGVEAITWQWRLRSVPAPLETRAAVVFNPTKVLDVDLFRRRVEFAFARTGWRPPLWLETQRDDPGRGMARDALTSGVDLVLVAGGDGTVRTVCAEMAGTGVPVGLLPAGTGNLLCRNLRIPLDEDGALDVALHGAPTAIDMVRWTADGMEAQQFAVMAGVGLDAEIMRGTHPQLKKVVKAGAYVVAAAQQLRMAPFRARVTVDGTVHRDGDALMALVGNVGRLQAGIELIPGADPTDGVVDVLVASGEGVRGMARLASNVRQRADVPMLRHLRGRVVEIDLDRPVAYQLDGDTEGEGSHFCAEVLPGALLVMTSPTPSRRRR
jgi:diacylglycerol kinase (ATP)